MISLSISLSRYKILIYTVVNNSRIRNNFENMFLNILFLYLKLAVYCSVTGNQISI